MWHPVRTRCPRIRVPTSSTEHYEQSTAISSQIGGRRAVARALFNRAESLKLQGEIAQARQTAEEALRIRRGIDEPASLATSLSGLGQINAVAGDLPAAKQLLTEPSKWTVI